MAAAVRSRFEFASFRFKNDAHWNKLTVAVSTHSLDHCVTLLEAYQSKPIEEKVNQLVLRLFDEGNFRGILCLVSALRHHERITDFARVCESGAIGMLTKNWIVKYKEVCPLAERLAAECRERGEDIWLRRAPFFEQVSKAVVSQSEYIIALQQLKAIHFSSI